MSDIPFYHPIWMAILSQLCVLSIIFLAAYAACNDIKEYKIPNSIVVWIMGLFAVYAVVTPNDIDVLRAVITFFAVTGAGFLLFAVGIIGAGDIKFFAALSLWSGTQDLMNFFMVTAFVGGALAILYLIIVQLQKFLGVRSQEDTPQKVVLPYGVAIAAGGFYVAYQHLQPILGITSLGASGV